VDADDGSTGAEREGMTWDCLGGGQPMSACSTHSSRQATGETWLAEDGGKMDDAGSSALPPWESRPGAV
jgi:hypothetical protein